HMPSQGRRLRSVPLPKGVEMLLRIAAEDSEAERAAVALTGRSHQVIREAAAFFIEQIMFAPDADSYRVLGADPQATASELRRNVALLLRWLHPDRGHRGEERSIFVGRITRAWNDLKTPERRAAYDKSRRLLHENNGGREGRKTSSRRHSSGRRQ